MYVNLVQTKNAEEKMESLIVKMVTNLYHRAPMRNNRAIMFTFAHSLGIETVRQLYIERS